MERRQPDNRPKTLLCPVDAGTQVELYFMDHRWLAEIRSVRMFVRALDTHYDERIVAASEKRLFRRLDDARDVRREMLFLENVAPKIDVGPAVIDLHQLFLEAQEDIERECLGPLRRPLTTIDIFRRTIAELLHGIRRARPSPP